MPKTIYNGQEVKYEDCTPSWSAIIGIHIAVLQNPGASDEGIKSAVSEIKRMAEICDRYNELIKAGFNPEEFLGNKKDSFGKGITDYL